MNRNYIFLLPFLQVLVEIDDEDWERREWFNVYKDNYQLFAVEQTLVLAKRSSGTQLSRGDLHPAFVSTITQYLFWVTHPTRKLGALSKRD